MKLIVGLKLKPTIEQANTLRQTLVRANKACDAISQHAWECQTFKQFNLQKLTYRTIRDTFDLSAQMIVRLIAKVTDAYKLDRQKQRHFRPHGSIAYDDRILRYGDDYVSIWTVGGRERIPFVCDERARRLLTARQGESDLLYRGGKFYLFATVNAIEPPPGEPESWLGVDFGIVNLATDSDREFHAGGKVKGLRKRHAKLRARLQAKGTRAAKRLLKKRRLKEAHFAKDVNHCISKELVRKAQHTNRGIAIENLKGIRARVRVRKSQRRTLHSWSFAQLRSFIEYKAKLAGVAVQTVDPRNTSRQCPECGHTDKANRRNQAEFWCQTCGYSEAADFVAARNIAGRVLVNVPYTVSGLSAA
jgi:putative transposase